MVFPFILNYFSFTFSLNNSFSGEVKGRYSTHVRICSCPGRDIRGEEVKVEESQEQAASEQPGSNNLIPIAFPPAGTKGKTKKRKTTPPTTSTTSPTSRFSTQNEGDVYRVSMEVSHFLYTVIFYSVCV